MPLYEYQCDDCGKEFERLVRFSEMDKKQTCPTCESEETHKVVSAFSSFGGSSGGGLVSTGGCQSTGGFS